MKRILSIQSSVAFGHVGNSAATFPMQRMGAEVLPVYTVLFSNSTAYGAWRGPVISPDDVREVIMGVDDRGELERVDAVLSGYQGDEHTGRTIVDAAALVKQRNPRAIYACDPVMGNKETGCFVRPGIPEFIREHCVPAADIITPNHFELGFLTELPVDTLEQTFAAADALLAKGPRVVVVTGVDLPDAKPDELAMLAVTREGAWLVVTPKIDRVFNGAGDVTAATFLVKYLQADGDVAAALAETASILYAVMDISKDAADDELALIEAQDVMVNPPQRFVAQQIR